jgi:hypothetical protein
MEEFYNENPKSNKDFEDHLLPLLNGEHPSCAYYIFKTIILNNLYGVDLMKEAVEIAKLRLFLKLVAEVDPSRRKKNFGLEPLPDIDFNIRSGNTLVGFATERQLEEVVRKTDGDLIYEERVAELKSACETASASFTHFRQMQMVISSDSAVIRRAKHDYANVIIRLNEKLNRYLADTYGLGAKTQWKSQKEKEQAYRVWKESYQPFHWFAEFYEIISRGGFDVVIGNPPYVEYSKVKNMYQVKEYQTINCGNLYAFVVERAFSLQNKDASFGMIIPLSITCGERMKILRELIFNNMVSVTFANFEIFPSKLFDGAFQRLTIICGQKSSKGIARNLITKLHRWYSVERENLIDKMVYTTIPYIEKMSLLGKFQSINHLNIIDRISRCNYSIKNFCLRSPSKFFIYYQEATNYWMKATARIPFYCKNSHVDTPDHGRIIYIEDKRIALSLLAIINSSLFYLWYIAYSDGFHLSDMLVKFFPLDEKLTRNEFIIALGEKLEKDIKQKSIRTTRNTKNDKIEIESFKLNLSKPIIDKIDEVLAKHYGFTEEELDFIINYDIKYRMGGELEGEE